MSEDASGKLKKEQRKDSILETALRVMATKGIESTTMREIASAEGISETLLYRFFSNKEEIIFELIQTKINKTFERFDELIISIKGMIPDPKITIPIIWRLTRNKIMENKELISLLMKERVFMRDHLSVFLKDRTQKGEPLGLKIAQAMQKMQIETVLTEYFIRCQKAGTMRKDIDIKFLTPLFLRLLIAPIMPNPIFLQGGLQEPTEEEMDKLIEVQMDIFLNGILN